MKALALWVALAPALAPAQAVLQVLCYHRFAPDCGKDPYCVGDAELQAQLAWLKAQGWESVGLTRVARALDGLEPLPPKAVMLSVDDGYKAGFRGAEAFEAAGYRGVFFVNPGSLAAPASAARSAFGTAQDLRDLEARGHDIGSHGMTHANLGRVPTGLDVEAYRAWLDRELAGSRRALERILGHPVTDLAWPYGAYNEAVIRAAQAAGYRQLYTVTHAAAWLPGADRLRLPRYLLQRPLSQAAFRRNLAAARAPAALDGWRDGQVEYDEAGRPGFRFVEGRVEGLPARVLVQRARPALRPYFEALTTHAP